MVGAEVKVKLKMKDKLGNSMTKSKRKNPSD